MDEHRSERIGTAEREQTQLALNTHFGAGRIELAELEERSSQVAAARTSDDLAAVLHDLPSTAVSTPAASQPVDGGATVAAPAPHRRAIIPALMPFVAVALYFTLRDSWDTAWLVFLLVPVAGLLFRSTRDPGPEQR